MTKLHKIMEENQKLVKIALGVLYVFKREAYFRALHLEIEIAKGPVLVPKGTKVAYAAIGCFGNQSPEKWGPVLPT
jgi:hypothetical protein